MSGASARLLREVAQTRSTSSSSSGALSEEDYDRIKIDPATVVHGAQGGGLDGKATLDSPRRTRFSGSTSTGLQPQKDEKPISIVREQQTPIQLQETATKGQYLLQAHDPELMAIIKRGIEAEMGDSASSSSARFRDLVFTRQFTTFDRQNPMHAGSVFHGFFTLFWLGTFLLLVKIAAENYKVHGSILGRSEIVKLMFHHDVLVLLASDGVLCASTVFSLGLQKLVFHGYLSWNRSGWIIQHIWQTFYLGAVIRWTIHRKWPWTHTVFIVLHTIVMLMKMHSYAFYTGHLSELYKHKLALQKRLIEVEQLDLDANPPDAASSPISAALSTLGEPDSTTLRQRHPRAPRTTKPPSIPKTDYAAIADALSSGTPLQPQHLTTLQHILRLELASLDTKLRGKCSSGRNAYPRNLSLGEFAAYIPLPTVVYELEYPRLERIDWSYVAEKALATFGVIGVMVLVSEALIYPSVMRVLAMKAAGVPLADRLREFPWLLSDLTFPFMLEYLLAWYVIWECVLNLLAELTRFADRGFYADWWNSVSWDQFARDWNRPVHAFLLRHVYHSSISTLKLSRPAATAATFLLSACVHELVMWCIFKKLRGYLLVMQMMQLPLAALSRSRWMRRRLVLGNVVFWMGIFTGPTFLCSLYLIL